VLQGNALAMSKEPFTVIIEVISNNTNLMEGDGKHG
jgi:hypothetical protein